MKLVEKLLLTSCLMAACFAGISQYNRQQWVAKIDTINADNNLYPTPASKEQKLKGLYQQFEQQNLPKDSVCARMLHRIGLYESQNYHLETAIAYTKKAYLINSSGKPGCSLSYSAKNCFNLGIYYRDIGNPHQALYYFTTAKDLILTKKLYTNPDRANEYYGCCMDICHMYAYQGKYQEAYNLALNTLQQQKKIFCTNNDIPVIQFWAAFSAKMLEKYTEAERLLHLVQSSFYPSDGTGYWYLCKELEVALAVSKGRNDAARQILKQTADTASRYQDTYNLCSILTSTANFYTEQLKDLKTAEKIFLQEEVLLNRTSSTSTLPELYMNLGHLKSLMWNQKASLNWFQKALQIQAGKYAKKSVLENPSFDQLVSQPNEASIFICMRDKAEMLLRCYRENKDKAYLKTSEQSFKLADSLFTHMRHNQTGEESKLYWRSKTRKYLEQALEMCYVKQDADLAFYYMERSRAVLLNDRLNEIGASRFLPESTRQQEQELKERVIATQYELSKYSIRDVEYDEALNKKIIVDNQLSGFIAKLETDNKDYYRYKYANSTPAAGSLKQYLGQHNQQWVQYFVSDSLLFVLYADGQQMRLYRTAVDSLEQTMKAFLGKCVDKEWQNSHYSNFLQISNALYKTVFNLIPLRPGRLIISPDNAPIPFDALCTDVAARKMMLHNFAISYAYSADFLLQPKHISSAPQGSFVGIAPINYPAALNLGTLTGSKEAIEQSGSFYPNPKLIIGKEATSRAFFKELPHYTVANLYTHASGNDTLEPELYFIDTAIRLSELQRIQNPATEMVVLSACQTDAGKLASGEGVFSIARGFAMAGIPCTVATLWKADASAMYFISNRFHYYLNLDSTKDVALQRAKLDYMQQSKENQLPFYWANMTLTGNAERLHLKESVGGGWPLKWILLAIAGASGVAITYWLQLKNRRVPASASTC